MEAGGDGALVASERYGSAEIWKYSLEDGKLNRKREDCGSTGGTGLVGAFKSVFLPQGYPESVSGDYLQYQLWDTAQAFCSSLSGTLATQASLRGVGVGNQEATVAAATVTWLLRDGTGMLGRILFAWRKGTKLDSEAKKWRLFADVLNDIAMFIEILAPFFPAFFLLIMCMAGVFKSIVGVAGGATRAALTVHQARRDNMADISAKDGSQETLVNLAGLVVSLLLIPLVTENPALTLGLFFFFTALHLVSNFRAVRSVRMETLNEARLDIVWHHFVNEKQQILTLREANEKEPVFNWFCEAVPIRLGVKLQEVINSPDALCEAVKERQYLVGVRDGCVCVSLGQKATVRDEFKAVCHALSLRMLMRKRNASKQQRHRELVYESRELVEKYFPPFMKLMEETEWELTRNLFDWDEWRFEWKTKTN